MAKHIPIRPKGHCLNTLDVDAMRQGNSNQAKDGKSNAAYLRGHEHEVCNHCGKAGYRLLVCLTRFMGKSGIGMPRSGPDLGPDPNRTEPHLRSGPVRGAVPNFPRGSGSGCSLS